MFSFVKPWIAAPLVSLAILVGLWAERRLFHLPHGDASSYHARVTMAADHLPYRTGEWVGADVTIPRAAVTLLRPNVILGRRFSNGDTQERVTLLVVQCKDARDMRGHYPPVCYPCNGWTQRGEAQRKVPHDGHDVPTTVYRFTKESIHEYSELVVYSFFVLPNGAIEGDRAGLRRAAEDPRTRRYGAAQFQVTFGPSVSAERRDHVFSMLLEAVRPLLDTIRGGDSR